MPLVFNPGSENKGGTLNQARVIADLFMEDIRDLGIHDVERSEGVQMENGNFEFSFTHKLTGVSVVLQTHGFTEIECQKFIFHPRVYWNGSSTGGPKIEDWLTHEYSYIVNYQLKTNE